VELPEGTPVSPGSILGEINFSGDTSGFSTIETTARIRSVATASSGANIEFSTANAGSLQKRMTILSSGNVGIGSTAPDTKLHVVGTSGTTLKIVDGNQGAGKILTSDANGVASWADSSAPTNNPISSLDAATANNTIANAAFLQTWNWSLTGATQDGFTFGETAAATGGSGDQSVLKASALATSTATPLMVTNLGDGISFRVNDETGDTDTSPFVVNAGGNVGIGTASPNQALHIYRENSNSVLKVSSLSDSGTAISEIRSESYDLGGGGNTIHSKISMVTSEGDPISPTSVLSGRTLGVLRFMTNQSGTDYDLAGVKGNTHPITYDGSNRRSRLTFYTTALTTPEDRMTIDYNGNIGIGTTNPSTLLDLEKNQAGATSLRILNNDTNGGASAGYEATNGTTSASFSMRGTNANAWGAFSASDASLYTTSNLALMANSATGVIKFATGGNSEKMRIDEDGNVGIGSTAPDTKLHIVGSSGLTLKIVDGNQGAGKILTSDANGVATWADSSAPTNNPLSALDAATANNTVANAAFLQTWNWSLTGATEDGFTFGETTAATGGSGDQSVLKASTLAASTATPLLITNLGDGASLRVNDQTGDTDTSPFLIDAEGRVLVGGTSAPAPFNSNYDKLVVTGDAGASTSGASITILGQDGGNDGGYLNLVKNKNGASVIDGDNVGGLQFYGFDGTTYQRGAGVFANIDAAPGPADMPMRLSFYTTPDGSATYAERMRITSSGDVGIGTTAPTDKLTVKATGVGTGLTLLESYAGNSALFRVYENVADGAGASMTLGDGAGTNRIRFDSLSGSPSWLNTAANFGIGNNSPSARLDVTAGANDEAIASSGHSLTGANAQSLMDLSGTWNTTGTPTLIKANVTDTASNAASLLLDLQVGGISKFSLDKTGNVNVSGRMITSVTQDPGNDVTLVFTNTNLIRTTHAGACGTLAISGTTAGGTYTVTMPSVTATCTLPSPNIDGLPVKSPAGYAAGTAVTGVVYTLINDGFNVWISYVPF
jgi:hypothetical protein